MCKVKIFKHHLKARRKWSKYFWKKQDCLLDANLLHCHSITAKSTDELQTKIKAIATSLYQKFDYTYDSLFEFLDSLRPPAECYYQAINNRLKDDCDGFHSMMYFVLQENDIGCVLCTAIPLSNFTNGHTFLAFQNLEGKWNVLDYTKVDITNYDTLDQATREHYKQYGEVVVGLDVWSKTNNEYIGVNE